jgi:phenylalanyl-tRNA synthetase beta chain
MRVSMEWLRELVEVTLPVTELCDRLDMTGTKVEAVETVGEALEGVVVGQVLTKEPHPEADKLSYCTVDVAVAEPLRIVCGAQNFEVTDKVPVATIGAVLPNGIQIKRAKLRGLVSEGMMCSARELGVGGDAEGLLILPADAPVGMPFAQYQGLADVVLDLEITPNRPDCLAVAGVAREVGAILGQASRWPKKVPAESGAPIAGAVSVTIEDPALCPRYTARVIRGVAIAPSPDWLARRVLASGARPISNVVDATNYVMFLLGQPLHAFDLDTLGTADGKAAISVRSAAEGEKLTTLDGQERTLTADNVVIADPTGAVALAGVMGGESTEISDTTVNILLESASFDPASVSRTSRNLGLISEASSRFEKRVDPAGCVAANDFAAALIAELAGGAVDLGVVDVYPMPAMARDITLRVSRANRLIGSDLSRDEVADILRRLELAVVPTGDDDLTVTVPTWRPDLEREVDLVEEVVRLLGMENVTSTLPAGRGRVGGLTPRQRVIRKVGTILRAEGLNESIGLAFADPADVARLGWEYPESTAPVELVNPISEELSIMRPTLAARLLRQLADNQRHGVADVHLYEIAPVFLGAEGRKQPKEESVVGAVLAGSWAPAAWNQPASELGFSDGKGIVEVLLESLGIRKWRVQRVEQPMLQPGRSAQVVIGGQSVGYLGEVHPRVLEAFDAEGPVTLLELDLGALVRESLDAERSFSEIARFPGALRDIALLVDEDVSSDRVEQSIRAAGGKLLESVRLFDVYRGKGVPEGKKSLAYALVYRVADRTLTDEEVGAAHDKVARKVAGAVGAELRG